MKKFLFIFALFIGLYGQQNEDFEMVDYVINEMGKDTTKIKVFIKEREEKEYKVYFCTALLYNKTLQEYQIIAPWLSKSIIVKNSKIEDIRHTVVSFKK